MADTAFLPSLALPVDDLVLARLHGLACIACGRAGVPLSPAGHVYTCDGSGGLLGWPVAACPEHRADPCSH
nr:hypothetical protein [Streptomyces sp. 846.5]